LDSVTEKTYASVHSTCTDKLLEGDLTFAKVLKLYTHRCFQRYPHFQVEDIDKDDKNTISNNSTTFRRPRDKGTKGKGRSAIGRGRGGPRNSRPSNSSNPPRSRDNRPKGKGHSDRPPNKGKGKDNSSSRNTGTRQPKLDPCSYCGGASHNARNCFKRLADDKTKPTTMKQANQNIIIDEATMEFSQSVLFTHLSDSLPSTHTAHRWGEHNTNRTKDSDEINENRETDTNNGDTQEHEEDRALNELELTSNNFVCSDINNDQTTSVREKEEALTKKDDHSEQHPSTPLPTIEPLPYSSGSELTGVPMTASMTPHDEQGSSSVEPGWGRIESSKEKERMEDLRLWQSINIGGYTNQRTTKSYRHGRCYMCSKPVSTANLDPEMELFCKECDQELLELDCGYRSWEQADIATKRRLEKEERNDEEEWDRIPILQSDDSDSTDERLSEEPENHETTSTDDQNQNQKGYLNYFVAFLIAPRKDGRVLTKQSGKDN
jgi:hypothetical protein